MKRKIEYFQSVLLYKDQANIKKFLPFLFVFLLFQDVFFQNVNMLSHSVGKMVNYFDELVIILGLPYIFRLFNNHNYSLKRDYIAKSLLIMLLIGMISSIVNEVPLHIMLQGAFLTFKGFLLFYIIRSISFTKEDIQKFVTVFKNVTIVVVFFSIVDMIFPEFLRSLLHTNERIDIRMGMVSIQSIFNHPGVYGWYMGFVSLYLLANYKVIRKKKDGLLTIGAFIASFLSFRFKTVLGLILNTIFSFASYYRLFSLKKYKENRKFWWIIFVGIVVAACFIIVAGYLTVLTIHRYIAVDYTESARKALYIFGFLIAYKEFPFGVGIGRYGSWTAREHYSPVYFEYGLDKIYGLYSKDPKWATDTYWPAIMGEFGFIGAVLLLSIFFAMFMFIYRAYKRHHQSQLEEKAFLFFGLLVIIQSFIESFGEQVYNSGPQYIFIFSVLGVCFSIADRTIKEKGDNMKPTVLTIGSSLKDKGGIVTVIHNIRNSFVSEKFHLDMVETYITGSKRDRLKIFLKGFFQFLYKMFMNRPDVVHIHMSYKGSFYRKSIFILLTKLVFHVPTIVHIHGSSFKDFYASLSNVQKKYVKYVLNQADKLIVLSEEWKKFFSQIANEHKIKILYNGVHLSHFTGTRANDVPICLFLGRLGKRKGTYDLLECARVMKDRKLKFKLLLAGDGEIEKVEEYIKKYELQDYIEVLGWISGNEKTELLKKADIFVLPSYNEGLPMAILEAMDFGLPIVSTPVGGIPEAVKHLENGFLVQPGDIASIVLALEKLIINKDLRERMGEKNKEKVKNKFDLNVLLHDLEQVYNELIKNR
ncbi:glycosyltransferase [Anoxybacillus gonensis]|uniref:glycosyltransferase n=1 Tax=Anoxybacillus gonensis TaxID=198467 RepID=UPI0002C01696|nr:glycosyltransferase [Anoxybacillus gonensis]EMI10455.1 glycosyl transferase group 1 [Anoxybacillus gonensis]